MDFLAKFEGFDADYHVLPAFEGSQSLEGIARTFVLVSNYVATGTIRKRYPFDPRIRVYLKANRPGSFESVFGIFAQPDTVFTTTLGGTLAAGVAAGLVVELAKYLTRVVTGTPEGETTDTVERLAATRPGELEALAEAVEPAVKKAHTVVNNGAGQIIILQGDNNIVNFNARTKSFVTTTLIDQHTFQKRVSVGMLNANTRNGRVWDSELRRTVAIHVPRDAEPRTLGNLAVSLQRYSSRFVLGLDSEVVITATRVTAQDGTVKQYIVRDAVL